MGNHIRDAALGHFAERAGLAGVACALALATGCAGTVDLAGFEPTEAVAQLDSGGKARVVLRHGTDECRELDGESVAATIEGVALRWSPNSPDRDPITNAFNSGKLGCATTEFASEVAQPALVALFEPGAPLELALRLEDPSRVVECTFASARLQRGSLEVVEGTPDDLRDGAAFAVRRAGVEPFGDDVSVDASFFASSDPTRPVDDVLIDVTEEAGGLIRFSILVLDAPGDQVNGASSEGFVRLTVTDWETSPASRAVGIASCLLADSKVYDLPARIDMLPKG